MRIERESPSPGVDPPRSAPATLAGGAVGDTVFPWRRSGDGVTSTAIDPVANDGEADAGNDPADLFARLWQPGAPPPDLRAFLADHPGASPRQRVDAMLIDQGYRWRSGDRRPVEWYLRTFPEAAADPELKLDLVYGELRHACRGELEFPDLTPYVARFPDLREALECQVQVGGWVRETLSGEMPGPSAGRDRGPPAAIDGFEGLDEIGSGGMGVVYRAWQSRLQRPVALKFMHPGLRATPELRARFRAEAQAAARLRHPNIVSIYDVGEQGSCPFLAMEYVEGGSLDRRLDGRPMPPRRAAELSATLARAIHSAHLAGVVHRDLKPANILLTADGQPKIADFGLAKVLFGPAAGDTRTEVIMGTPRYMAPEQADRRLGPIGPAADIHALGVILYEMITGRAPFLGIGPLDTLEQIRTREPTPPRQLLPDLSADLETICLTCLHKDPGRRYSSADALADDLRGYLAGEPIRARPPCRRWRAALRSCRKPAVLTPTAALLAAGFSLSVGAGPVEVLAISAAAVTCSIAGGAGHAARLREAIRDLAEQHAEADRRTRRLRDVLEMVRRMARADGLEDQLRLIGETTARVADAERATIFLIDRDRGELRSRFATGCAKELRVPLGVGLAGTVAVTGQPIYVPDSYADDRFYSAIDTMTGYRTRNLLTIPMTGRLGAILGVFQILNRRSGTFVAEEEEVLMALVDAASAAIEAAGPRADLDGPPDRIPTGSGG